MRACALAVRRSSRQACPDTKSGLGQSDIRVLARSDRSHQTPLATVWNVAIETLRGNATMLSRRTVLASSAVLLSAGLMPYARAEVLKKSAQIIVGFPAGGGTDVIARILAERLRGPYSSAVIVENKPGAAARISVEYVKSAEPDGSVMLFTPDFPITVYPHSFKALSYDPVRDFTAVSPAAKSMLAYNVGPAVPESVKTLAEFAQWCKANPGKASYATTAAGGTPHFVGMMLANAAGVAMTPVHYRGGAPALQDLPAVTCRRASIRSAKACPSPN